VSFKLSLYPFKIQRMAYESDLSYWDVASSSVFFQFSLYIAVRLAHRGFTLGELGLVVFGATALFMELNNLTIARVRLCSECVYASGS
jgi:dolichol kinase